jgi:hypothetical protein
MFNELENILIEIREELRIHREIFQMAMDSLSTKKQVAKFLSVSTKTIENYVKDGRFRRDVEYVFDDCGELHFVPTAIIEFRKMGSKKEKIANNFTEKIIHPSASKILSKISKGTHA